MTSRANEEKTRLEMRLYGRSDDISLVILEFDPGDLDGIMRGDYFSAKVLEVHRTRVTIS